MQLASVWEGAPSHYCGLTMFGNSEVFFVSLSLLSLCFVIIIKYSRAQRGKTSITPPHDGTGVLGSSAVSTAGQTTRLGKSSSITVRDEHMP